jgi:2-iminoacetate synthase
MTLKEYLMDYASPETLRKGLRVIAEELERVPHPKVRRIATENLQKIELGERDFRF